MTTHRHHTRRPGEKSGWRYLEQLETRRLLSGTLQHSATSLPPDFINGGVTVGPLAFFTDGAVVETYDVHTNKWYRHSLPHPRIVGTVVADGDEVVFLGGDTFNRRTRMQSINTAVDVYNVRRGKWYSAAAEPYPLLGQPVTVGSDIVMPTRELGDQSDVYTLDLSTNDWSTDSLPTPRGAFAMTAAGGRVFFAGGGVTSSNGTKASNVVDILNPTTGQWSTAALSQARWDLAAAVVGDQVVFAGGEADSGASAAVDIYNTSSNTWTTGTLSEARANPTAVVSGSDAFFAGGQIGAGFSNAVDIFNAGTMQWSTASLSQARAQEATAVVGPYVLFAGGFLNTDESSVVDIYDTSSQQWSTSTLSSPRVNIIEATLDDVAIFAGGSGGPAPGYLFSGAVDLYST